MKVSVGVQFWPGAGPERQDCGSQVGTSHLLQAPSAMPNDTTRTMAHTLRMQRSPTVPHLDITDIGLTGRAIPRHYPSAADLSYARSSRVCPCSVRTTRDAFIKPPFSMRTSPSLTASSQIDIRGQVLRHASMVSP